MWRAHYALGVTLVVVTLAGCGSTGSTGMVHVVERYPIMDFASRHDLYLECSPSFSACSTGGTGAVCGQPDTWSG